jgi:hypothetical protein
MLQYSTGFKGIQTRPYRSGYVVIYGFNAAVEALKV